MPAEPTEQSFRLHADFIPTGDQPEAIDTLVTG